MTRSSNANAAEVSRRFGGARSVTRRSFVGGVGAGMALGGVGLTPTMAARQQATPAAEIRPSLHTYPLVQETKTFRIMVPHYGIDWANNEFTKWYEERTNVHIEWVVVEDDAAVTQLNLQLASGDYPDIIMGFNWSPFELTNTVVASYGGQGIFVPIQDYLADNAPNLNEYVIPKYPIAQQITQMEGGNVYAMPYINDCYHCQYNTQKIWINGGWLETLGLEMPTTTDEFVEVMRSFKDGDPNGNGQADEVPVTAEPGWPLDRFLINPFVLSPGTPYLYRNEDGNVTASYLQDGWLDALVFQRGLFDQGLLPAETFTQDNDQIRRLGDNNRIGVAPGVVAGVFVQQTSGTEGLWSDYRMLPSLEGPSGLRQSYKDYDEAHIPNVFVVTNKCDDPALAVAWADGLYEWEATIRSIIGVPDVQWRFAEEGEIGVDGGPARWAAIPGDPDFTGDNTWSWDQLSPSFRDAEDRLSQAVVGDPAFDTESILYNGCREALEPYAIPPERDLLRPVFTTEEAARVSELGKTLNDFVQQNMAQAVTGQVDPEGEWQSFQDQLKTMGVEEYIQIYQDAYDRVSS
jgi:putative aldouronate transport system substrate-binding protein